VFAIREPIFTWCTRLANLTSVRAAHSDPQPHFHPPPLHASAPQRERESAVDMHRLFQRDLVKARLATARALVRVLTDGRVREPSAASKCSGPIAPCQWAACCCTARTGPCNCR
jgi:hypothetical protein